VIEIELKIKQTAGKWFEADQALLVEGEAIAKRRAEAQKQAEVDVLQAKRDGIDSQLRLTQEYADVEAEIFKRQTDARVQQMIDAGVKEDTINQYNAMRAIQWKQTQVDRERQLDEIRWASASMIAQGLGDIANQLYAASGRKSKALFLMTKAFAIADIMIQAHMGAMKAIGQMGIYGVPMSTIIYALAAAKIGMIAGLTVAEMQQMREGGPIKGGSGTKDDVPIMAMGGEYVVRRKAVDKYGAPFFEALNRGMVEIPKNWAGELRMQLQPVMRSVPFFATGGMVPPAAVAKERPQELSIVNVIDPQLMERYMASSAGQKMLVNVMAANAYQVRKAIFQ